MRERLHRFAPAGLVRFREFLTALRLDPALPLPSKLLTDEGFAVPVPGGPVLEKPGFATKRLAAEYLHRVLDPLSLPDLEQDAALWSWLAAFFFDDVCPPVGGRRRPLANPHYVLEPNDYRRRYRHLLLTPYRLASVMPDHNRIFLDAPLSVHGEIIEQTVSRLYMFRMPGVRAAIDRLYFDEENGRPKRGIFPTKGERRGDLRNRFPSRVLQLQRTYDVGALSADQLIQLLGAEFAPWLKAS